MYLTTSKQPYFILNLGFLEQEQAGLEHRRNILERLELYLSKDPESKQRSEE